MSKIALFVGIALLFPGKSEPLETIWLWLLSIIPLNTPPWAVTTITLKINTARGIS